MCSRIAFGITDPVGQIVTPPVARLRRRRDTRRHADRRRDSRRTSAAEPASADGPGGVRPAHAGAAARGQSHRAHERTIRRSGAGHPATWSSRSTRAWRSHGCGRWTQIRRQRSLSGTTEPAWLIGAFAAIAALLAGLGRLRRARPHGAAAAARDRDSHGARRERARSPHACAEERGADDRHRAWWPASAVRWRSREFCRACSSRSRLSIPRCLISAAALMAVVGLVAAALPASRASRVDPTTVLRARGEASRNVVGGAIPAGGRK